MKKQKITKGVIATSEKAGRRKSNTGNKTGKGSGNRNMPGKVNNVPKIGEGDVWEYVSEDILKTCEDLKSICMKMDDLEKEKQKLIYLILKNVPKKRRMRK